METPWREWLKNAKFVYWLIVGGLAFFAVVIALGMVEIISTQQILLLGQVVRLFAHCGNVAADDRQAFVGGRAAAVSACSVVSLYRLRYFHWPLTTSHFNTFFSLPAAS